MVLVKLDIQTQIFVENVPSFKKPVSHSAIHETWSVVDSDVKVIVPERHQTV